LALFFAPLPESVIVELKPATVAAFDAYMRTAETRLEAQRKSPAFLWADGSPERKRQLLQGKALAEPWSGKGDTPIQDGLIHDWVGAVFIPGAKLENVLRFVQDYDHHKNIYKPEVIDSRLLSHDGPDYKIHLRLLKKKILTVVLNTQHDVHYYPLDGRRASSRSYSARIAEVESPGEPKERELTPGRDHGFLWRLNSFWRFEERDGGVYVECEAISLTRNVPTGLGWLINPIVRGLPKDSLMNTLRETRDAAVAR
jgi:hypothetical protein